MPIYEFYCVDCHIVFNFLSRRANTTRRPACPHCGRAKLDRKISRFAIGKRPSASPTTEDGLPANFDEAKMERIMAGMASDSGNMNDDDPRQMGRMLRRLYEGTGLSLGKNMQEAIRRMEAGEDPDKIDEEMGDLLDQEDPLLGEGDETGCSGRFRHFSRRLRPPKVDETLYEL